jgi:hypothetical protein
VQCARPVAGTAKCRVCQDEENSRLQTKYDLNRIAVIESDMCHRCHRQTCVEARCYCQKCLEYLREYHLRYYTSGPKGRK